MRIWNLKNKEKARHLQLSWKIRLKILEPILLLPIPRSTLHYTVNITTKIYVTFSSFVWSFLLHPHNKPVFRAGIIIFPILQKINPGRNPAIYQSYWILYLRSSVDFLPSFFILCHHPSVVRRFWKPGALEKALSQVIKD